MARKMASIFLLLVSLKLLLESSHAEEGIIEAAIRKTLPPDYKAGKDAHVISVSEKHHEVKDAEYIKAHSEVKVKEAVSPQGHFEVKLKDKTYSQGHYGSAHFAGLCGADGYYYNDAYSYVSCSNGRAYIQPCPAGTRNNPSKLSDKIGHIHIYSDFCNENLNDYATSADTKPDVTLDNYAPYVLPYYHNMPVYAGAVGYQNGYYYPYGAMYPFNGYVINPYYRYY